MVCTTCGVVLWRADMTQLSSNAKLEDDDAGTNGQTTARSSKSSAGPKWAWWHAAPSRQEAGRIYSALTRQTGTGVVAKQDFSTILFRAFHMPLLWLCCCWLLMSQ